MAANKAASSAAPVGAGLVDKEHRVLQSPKLLEEAKAVQVVWARVKGYPAWPVSRAALLRG